MQIKGEEIAMKREKVSRRNASYVAYILDVSLQEDVHNFCCQH
jgi:hypothetical protein